ncbi:MAG: hypothetical protein IPN94_16165 [Sphingobacteriales bacterium]|nr:hypothetical protein [Sphingobacteriales bacterium]
MGRRARHLTPYDHLWALIRACPQVGIFNGMGTKGITLAPYFAQHFVNHLIHQQPLDVEVDVKRYFK